MLRNAKDAQKLEETYNKIVSFYDFAEDLVNTVEDARVKDPVTQLEFAEPMVEKVENSTDYLAEEFRKFVKTGKRPGFLERRKVEKALLDVYEVIEECKRIKKLQEDK